MNFYKHLSKVQELPSGYKNLYFLSNEEILYLESNFLTKNEELGFHVFDLIPDYLHLTLDQGFYKKKIKQFNKGYAIDLQNFEDVQIYVKNQFQKDYSKVTKRLERINLCFDIRYVVYEENTTIDEYEFLMGALKKMLISRFEQRDDKNENLQNWADLHGSVMSNLKNGKALLSVIYDGEKPIQITVSYKLQKILFSAIPAYDIDYYKYGLGNSAIYKQIEWCLQNDFKIIEMGYGDLDYKRRWSNMIYFYEHHLLYPKSDYFLKCKVQIKYILVFLKEYLKRKKLKHLYDNLVSSSIFKKSSKTLIEQKVVQLVSSSASVSKAQKVLINIESSEHAFLRKIVYDFQYIHMEHKSKIKTFKLEDKENTFVICGTNKEMVFTLEP